MRPSTRLRAVICTAAATALLAACRNDATSPPPPRPDDYGTSTLTSAGAVSVQRQGGIAVYADGGVYGRDAGFALVTATSVKDTAANMVAISRARSGVPSVGTYAFHDATTQYDASSDAFELFAVLAGDRGNRVVACGAAEGTVTVSSTAGGRLKGSYRARADCIDVVTGVQTGPTTISGTFEAVDATKITGRPWMSRPGEAARGARIARLRG